MIEIEEKIIGLTEKQAKKLVEGTEDWICVTQEDDKTFCITCDVNFNRIQVTIENGLIIEAGRG